MSSRSLPLILLTTHLLVAGVAAYLGALYLAPTLTPQGAATDEEEIAADHAEQPPLFQVGQRQYGFYDLPIEYRRPLHEIRKMAFEQQRLLVEEAVVEAYIQQQIAAQQSNRMTVQNALMPGAEPSEAEIDAFYRENQSQSSPPLEQIREQIRTYLTAAKQEQLKRQLLTQLLVQGKAQLLLEAPLLERPN